MKRLLVILAIFAFLLPACGEMPFVTSAPNPFAISPSPPPKIFSPTPVILVYPTTSATLPPPPSLTPSPEITEGPSPTATETWTPTPTVTTSTPMPLTVQLLGCDTGLDITHGMGEVTNAYVTLINASSTDLTSVCVTLSAADEGRVHPDKTACVPSLPGGYQVTLKLTIDTTFKVDTIVEIGVTSNEGILASDGGQACRDIDILKPPPEEIGEVKPIP